MKTDKISLKALFAILHHGDVSFDCTFYSTEGRKIAKLDTLTGWTAYDIVSETIFSMDDKRVERLIDNTYESSNALRCVSLID